MNERQDKSSSNSVQIPDENIFDFTHPSSVFDVPAQEIATGKPHYAAITAGRTARTKEKEQGRDSHVLIFNAGHAQILYDHWLLDKHDLYKVIDRNGDATIYAAVSVEWLLELAQFGEHERIKEHASLANNPSEPNTYYGIIASATFQQLNQTSLTTKKSVIERMLRPQSMERKLQDCRKTRHSITAYAKSIFEAEKALEEMMATSAKYLLQRLDQICPKEKREAEFDQASLLCIAELEDAIRRAEEELKTSKPPSLSPSPTVMP